MPLTVVNPSLESSYLLVGDIEHRREILAGVAFVVRRVGSALFTSKLRKRLGVLRERDGERFDGSEKPVPVTSPRDTFDIESG